MIKKKRTILKERCVCGVVVKGISVKALKTNMKKHYRGVIHRAFLKGQRKLLR